MKIMNKRVEAFIHGMVVNCADENITVVLELIFFHKFLFTKKIYLVNFNFLVINLENINL